VALKADYDGLISPPGPREARPDGTLRLTRRNVRKADYAEFIIGPARGRSRWLIRSTSSTTERRDIIRWPGAEPE